MFGPAFCPKYRGFTVPCLGMGVVQSSDMKKILAFIDDIYEDLELLYPKIRLEEEGWQVTVAGPVQGTV